ncbi:MAG TPA: hypothetical protein VHQ95_05850 [Pyrinomonadaceae bacterium]|jgi:hypothetical protein|nr:hypothetical protein [Pyrinomonadaceae bacterium]
MSDARRGFALVARFILVIFVLVLLPCLASAKRAAPARVEPVIQDGIRYVAPNDDGRRAYIEAWDGQTNKKLWELTVFTNRIDPKLEEDVQWVFIDKLGARDGTLMVKSESGNTYQVDLKTKAVTQSELVSSPAPGVSTQSSKILDAIEKAIASGRLAKEYDVSFRVNPFYLDGDFNGDGKIDVAVLVKQGSTGKIGIAIIHSGKGKVTVLGAGNGIGNGGDDFEWMDYWQLYPKGRTGETTAPRLRGDALLVGKSEAASALIYWNGKRYMWFQQGD